MDEFDLEIKIHTLPSTQPDVAGRYTRARERKGLRQSTVEAVHIAGGPPKKPLEHAHLTMTRHSSSEPDYENLAYSFKSAVDALRRDDGRKGDDATTCAGVIVDDTPKHVDREYLWQYAKPGEGFITIRIRSI